jgi:hypothetical protein
MIVEEKRKGKTPALVVIANEKTKITSQSDNIVANCDDSDECSVQEKEALTNVEGYADSSHVLETDNETDERREQPKDLLTSEGSNFQTLKEKISTSSFICITNEETRRAPQSDNISADDEEISLEENRGPNHVCDDSFVPETDEESGEDVDNSDGNSSKDFVALDLMKSCDDPIFNAGGNYSDEDTESKISDEINYDDLFCGEETENTNFDMYQTSPDEDSGLRKQIIIPGRNDKESRHDLCVYCKRYVLTSSFVRHVLRQHKEERKVIEIDCQKKDSLMRKRLIQRLRNLGNLIHNKRVFKKGGSLIVAQKPKNTINLTRGDDVFVCCRRCLGFYSRRDVWRHCCPNEKPDEKKSTIKTTSFMCGDDLALTKFIQRIRNTKVALIIKNDELICSYITQELLKKGFKGFYAISNQVHLLALLLDKIKTMSGKNALCLADLLTTNMFDALHKGVIAMFNYSPFAAGSTGEAVNMTSPSSLIKLCQTLSNVCQTLHVKYLKSGNSRAARKTVDVQTLIDKEMRPLMQNANKTMRCSQSGIPQELPQTGDIMKLKDHLQQIINETTREKENNRLLKEAVLCYLIIFNKRRSSEVAKLTITTWNLRQKWKERAEEEMDKLDPTEQILVKTMEVCYVKGKGNKFVPILFPETVVPIIQYLSELGSVYIFENDAQSFIRGNDAVRRMTAKAGIDGRHLTSTKFRKLAATTLQVS